MVLSSRNITRPLGIAFLIVLTSCYFFPTTPKVLPINTKMSMAIIAIGLFLFKASVENTGSIKKYFGTVFTIACLISLASVASVVYNNTNDYTFVTYVFSAFTWIGGAYTLVQAMRLQKPRVTLFTVSKYLAAAGFMQCIIALLLNRNEVFFNFVDTYIESIQGLSKYADGRLFGIGCAFDPAGIKFSAILILIGYQLPQLLTDWNRNKKDIIAFTISYMTISVIGNMISRTTIVGIGISVLYMIFRMLRYRKEFISRWFAIVLLISIPTITYFYNHDAKMHKDLRFAFEGFFSLAETGEWNVKSNNILKTMYRFPDNTKTWIIGDGYIVSAENDPYYTGEGDTGYYKSTDVGYCRYLFYFGIIGLSIFIIYFLSLFSICNRKDPKNQDVYFLTMVLNFIVWLKVATDVFPPFALFLVIDDTIPEDVQEK